MTEPACPGCGETDRLRGRPTADGIVITCQQCGLEWVRGEVRCRKCGRHGGESARQQLTRHPRGTLLAVVGSREVTLCAVCDAEVLGEAREQRAMVPEGYVSRFLYGEPTEAELPAPAPRQARRPPAAKESESRPTPVAPKPAPRAQPTDPTLRQAVEDFLTEAGEASDHLPMVFLGQELGAATRLGSLDSEQVADRLAQWVAKAFGARGGQREQAADTLRRASAYWQGRGWLSGDLARKL